MRSHLFNDSEEIRIKQARIENRLATLAPSPLRIQTDALMVSVLVASMALICSALIQIGFRGEQVQTRQA